MSVLISSDLHLTDKDRDEYRWGLFEWILEQIPKYKVDTLMFLGDTTDAKDRHSAKLTNRIVGTLFNLSQHVQRFIILRGNHDYMDEKIPFFKFMHQVNGNIQLILEPSRMDIYGVEALLLPNMRTFNGFEIEDDIRYVFCHQTFKGARVENNTEMDGCDPAIFDGKELRVISGDVHVPQKLGEKIIYVGAPYHIHYNDKFIPRVLLLDDNFTLKSLRFPTISKHTLVISKPEDLEKFTLHAKDQVKVRLIMDDLVDWAEYKTQVTKFCADNDIDLHQIEPIKRDAAVSLLEQRARLQSMTPLEVFNKYCEATKVGEETGKYGRQIIVKNNVRV